MPPVASDLVKVALSALSRGQRTLSGVQKLPLKNWLLKFIKGKCIHQCMYIYISKKNLTAKSYELGWSYIWHQCLESLIYTNPMEESAHEYHRSSQLRVSIIALVLAYLLKIKYSSL